MTGPVMGRGLGRGPCTGLAGSRALSMSAMAIGSLAISRWSLESRTHWRLTVMLVTFEDAGRMRWCTGSPPHRPGSR